MNYDYSTRYLRALVNSMFLRVKGGFCLHSYRSGIRDVQLSSISGWCIRRYPVIEIRYTSALAVSSQHNNAWGINSTREKSADGVYIDVMPVRFYAISRPKVEFHSHAKMDKLCKKRDRVDVFLFFWRKRTVTLNIFKIILDIFYFCIEIIAIFSSTKNFNVIFLYNIFYKIEMIKNVKCNKCIIKCIIKCNL